MIGVAKVNIYNIFTLDKYMPYVYMLIVIPRSSGATCW
jgi:hypothetical protein